MLGENYRQLTTKTEIACGSGKIIYFPQKAYPAETMLKADYVEAMKEIAAKAAGEETCQGWMEAAPSVGFTVWDHSDRRTIYLLNTDWASDQDQRPATFIYKGKKFPVVVRRYHIETIHCADGFHAGFQYDGYLVCLQERERLGGQGPDYRKRCSSMYECCHRKGRTDKIR